MDEIEQLCHRYPALKPCADSIHESSQLLVDTFRSGNKLLLCGNGGSAADCEHISGELIKRFNSPRLLTPELSGRLGPELAREPARRIASSFSSFDGGISYRLCQ